MSFPGMQSSAVLLEIHLLVIAILVRFNGARALMFCSLSQTDDREFRLASRGLLSDLLNKA